jgi:hypothetical protein
MINPRYDQARMYLEALNESLRNSWLEQVDKPLSIFQKLALLHPDHYGALDLPCNKSVEVIKQQIQGKRKFERTIITAKCECHIVWGYDCRLDTILELDHLFPYALGGPTIGTNRITLCKYHNMVKSSDVHCFPWEFYEKWCVPWVDMQLKKLRTDVFELYS